MDDNKVSKLVALIEAKLANKAPANKPKLRIIEGLPPPRGMDSITRESHIKMINHLRKRYGLQIIVDQATFGRAGIEQLEDQELIDLHQQMFRARDCLAEGISLEDAGLIKSFDTAEACL